MPHTPGPYRIGRPTGQIAEFIEDCNGYRIANLIYIGQVVRLEADAHLLAAAPELLAACERFITWDNNNQSPDVPADLRKAIQDAISKTKG